MAGNFGTILSNWFHSFSLLFSLPCCVCVFKELWLLEISWQIFRAIVVEFLQCSSTTLMSGRFHVSPCSSNGQSADLTPNGWGCTLPSLQLVAALFNEYSKIFTFLQSIFPGKKFLLQLFNASSSKINISSHLSRRKHWTIKLNNFFNRLKENLVVKKPLKI